MKPDLKKLVILNLPYLLFVYLFGKVGEAWRLAAGRTPPKSWCICWTVWQARLARRFCRSC